MLGLTMFSLSRLIIISIVTTAIPFALIESAFAQAQMDCDGEIIHEQSVHGRGTVRLYEVDGAYLFKSHMFVNADGAPDAYRPDGKGLSYTCDGMVAYKAQQCIWPTNKDYDWQIECNAAYKAALQSDWSGDHLCVFGIQMDGGRKVGNSTVGGRPFTQKNGDPKPGNYISGTTMRIAGAPSRTQRQYVNSRQIPFFVIQGRLATKMGFKVDENAPVGFALRTKNSTAVAAIVADQGPTWQMGEGSIALHKKLGSDPIEIRSGTERAKQNIIDDIVYVIFPDTEIEGSLNSSTFTKRIEMSANAALESWGGLKRLKACASID